MWDQEEEETQGEDWTSWRGIHLKCSQVYEQKLITSLLNGSFMSVLTFPIQPSQTTTRGACSSLLTFREQEYQNGCPP